MGYIERDDRKDTINVLARTCEDIGGKFIDDECNVTGEVHPEIKEVIEEKGIHWLVSAMVHESIGYHTPVSAGSQIRGYFDGKRVCGCERCSALYGSREKEILADIKGFKYLEKNDLDRVKNIMNRVKQLSKLGMVEQMTAGLMYPTTG